MQAVTRAGALASLALVTGCPQVLGLDETRFVGGDGGTTDGVAIDAPIDAAPARITSGLIARWNFDEGSGTVVADSSGVGAPLNLVIDGTVTWLEGALRIDADSIVASPEAATKVIDAVRATSELTAEVWFVPGNLEQTGPARIISCSIDTSSRNFQIGQSTNLLDGRFRSTTTGLNGSIAAFQGGSLALAVTHVAMTRNTAGAVRLYQNGAEIASATPGGTVDTWDLTYRLALVNEFTRDRDWLGELHLVAIYSRALGPNEIAQNYAAGARAP